MDQRSGEWHSARRGRVTGSIAGAILGHSPYMTLEQALRSMVRSYHNAPSEFLGGPHIDWGINHEGDATWQFQVETGLTVEKCGFFAYENFAGASPDGLVGDDAVFENKCPFVIRNGGEFKSINDQPHYYDQLQMEMLATGRSKAYFYQWTTHSTKLEIVYSDQDWIDENLPKLRQFYALYLSELDNPEHLEPLRVEINTKEARLIVDEISQISEAIDNATARKKELMESLVEKAGGNNALVWGHKLTKVEKEGQIKYAEIVKKHLPNLDLTPYRGKASVSWRLT